MIVGNSTVILLSLTTYAVLRESSCIASGGVSPPTAVRLYLFYQLLCYISRNGYWGTGAIAFISGRLQAELPGLRGFSERNLKNMRTFYEEWQSIDSNSAIVTAELGKNDDIEIRQLQLPNFREFPVEEFFQIGFTHHTAILSQVKTVEERYFYIKISADKFLKVDTLKKLMKEDLYHNQGSLPNNFMEKIPSAELARRAILSFKDEYMLDFINVEELGVLDNFVRKPNENPSIGIVLCKSADKPYVEYAVRDYDKPMGVATYKTATDMPERLRKALPDMEELKKLL